MLLCVVVVAAAAAAATGEQRPQELRSESTKAFRLSQRAATRSADCKSVEDAPQKYLKVLLLIKLTSPL